MLGKDSDIQHSNKQGTNIILGPQWWFGKVNILSEQQGAKPIHAMLESPFTY